MKDLRQAAQRALKAMEDGEDRADMIEFSDALIALRAALAEPEQKAKPITADEMSAWVKDTWEKCQAQAWQEPEHEVKNLADYEFKTYKTGGAELEAGFYSTDELRDLVKALDKMNAATERSMRRMK